MCISIFAVVYKFKISRPKYFFLWCLFLTIKTVQKGVYRNGGVFLQWDYIKSAPDLSFLHYWSVLIFFGACLLSVSVFLFLKIWVIHTVAGWEIFLFTRKADHTWFLDTNDKFHLPLTSSLLSSFSKHIFGKLKGSSTLVHKKKSTVDIYREISKNFLGCFFLRKSTKGASEKE